MGNHGDVIVDGHFEFFGGVEVDVVHIFDPQFQCFGQAKAGVGEDFLFVFDVIVKTGGFHVHGTGDITHGGIEIPFVAHQSQSGSHDFLPTCHFNRLTKLTNTC